MAQPVAGEGRIPVGFILDKFDPVCLGVGDDLAAPDIEHRPQNRPVRIELPQHPGGRHPGQPTASGAAQQVEQQGLHLVIGVVRGHNAFGRVRAGSRRQEAVAQFSGGSLDRKPLRSRQRLRIAPSGLKRQPQARRSLPHKISLRRPAGSQTMIEMGADHPVSLRRKDMQEDHAVDPAGHGGKQPGRLYRQSLFDPLLHHIEIIPAGQVQRTGRAGDPMRPLLIAFLYARLIFVPFPNTGEQPVAEKILIVDDDLDTLRLVGLLLQRKGYEILAADSGAQALEKAREEKPDLILLDVMMPDMDGIEVLRRLRGRQDTSEIPIIMFTAKSQVEDKVVGFETGADDYLTKPTHPAELTARVRSILIRSGSRGDDEKPALQKRARGRIISVIGARGGLGVTTVTINLALASMKTNSTSVVAAELTPGTGAMGLMLGLQAGDHLIPLLRKEASAITEVDLNGAIARHESGLHVLPASFQSGDARYRTSADQMARIVERLAYMYDEVFVDLGAGLPPGSEKVIDKTDSIVVVIDPIMLTLTQTRALLDELRMKVLGLGAIQVAVLNRVEYERPLSPREIQRHLGHSVSVNIPAAPQQALDSLNQGIPLSLLSPEERNTTPYRKLAAAVAAGGS